jgi:hypothetical protein
MDMLAKHRIVVVPRWLVVSFGRMGLSDSLSKKAFTLTSENPPTIPAFMKYSDGNVRRMHISGSLGPKCSRPKHGYL